MSSIILRNKVLASITEIQSELRIMFPDLNCGGCGIFASYLYKCLESKFSKVDYPSIVIFSPRDVINDIDDIIVDLSQRDMQHNPDAWLEAGVIFSHVAVEWGYRYHDGHSSFFESEWGDFVLQDGELPVEVLDSLVDEPSLWNTLYTPKDHTMIKRVIMKHFEPICT